MVTGKNEKWGSEEKGGKRGKEKEEKEKGESDLGKNKKGKTHFLPFFIFPSPSFFPQQSFTCFPKTLEFSGKKIL